MCIIVHIHEARSYVPHCYFFFFIKSFNKYLLNVPMLRHCGSVRIEW